MDTLPNPLTPADCDLRDFSYMPLDVLRLRDSDLAARLSGEEFRCAVLLWCAAWHQVPAGSLPDDDVNLAQYAGFGRMVGEWQKVRDGSLWGWVKCADGRLYHPVVCEKANEAWIAKHKLAYDKLCERIRKRNKGRPENGQLPLEVPEFEAWLDAGRPLERSLFPAEFRTTSGGKQDSSGGKGGDFRRKDGPLPPEGSGSVPEAQGAGAEKSADESAKSASDDASSGNSGVSAGNGDSSAGNDDGFRRNPTEFPPENSLKGEERKGTEGKGEVNTIGSNDGGGTASRAREIDGVLTAAGISVSLIGWERERGKAARGITPSQQQVIDLADMRVTPDELRKAYDLAVADRLATDDSGPINAGFVRAKLESVRRPPPPKREDNAWKRTPAGIERKASELGIVCPPGRDHAWLAEKCESALRQRAQQQGVPA